MAELTRSHATDGIGDFREKQTHLGFNLVPRGLLMSPYSGQIFDAICYDWMHIYAVSGIFQREVGLMLGKLHRMRPTPLRQANLHAVVSSFTPPAYFRGVSIAHKSYKYHDETSVLAQSMFVSSKCLLQGNLLVAYTLFNCYVKSIAT